MSTAQIICGDALALPLANASVDLCVTSPPYFGLRSYQDDGQHYAGQIGSEATPAEFVDALIAATREMVRVLKPSGSIFVNLGDKYNSAAGPKNGTATRANVGGGQKWYTAERGADCTNVPTKSLMGIPWRYALRCIDELGLILRAEIVLDKKNGLPESVTDRVRRSHEQVFHFVKLPRYFSAVDEVRLEHNPVSVARSGRAYRAGDQFSVGQPNTLNPEQFVNPLGALPGSVWPYTSEPFRAPEQLGVDHFAAFATALPRRIILGWSPAGVCTVCGEGRRPVGTTVSIPTQRTHNGYDRRMSSAVAGGRIDSMPKRGETTITGYACGCPAPQIPVTFTEFDYELDEMVTRTEMRRDPTWVNSAPTTPGVILDPFGGTGTTALVAKALGRTGISVDMSADYCRLAAWRCTDPGQMAAALQVERPEPVSPDQLDLFSEVPV